MNMAGYDSNNIFAKILRGEIPCYKVYEDEATLAFMDVMPQADGHVLVMPKSPSRNLLDADPAAVSKCILVAQKIAKATMEAFEADGIMLVQYNEAPAGQSVFHMHFHVIPRHEGIALRGHSGEMEDNNVLAANAERIGKRLS
jgi:histidine triad (HIT) family protein